MGAASAGGWPAFEIDATLSVADRRVAGKTSFTFRNTATNALSDLRLFAYPNRFVTDGTDVPHDLFDRVFPAGPSSARMAIRSLRIDGVPADFADGEKPEFAPGVLLTVPLSNAIHPGESVLVDMEFDLRVPKRFGSFGSHAGTLCLNGGWHPYPAALNVDGTWNVWAPPPRSAFRVRVTVDDREGRLFINGKGGETHPPGTPLTVDTEAEFLTLVFYSDSHVSRRDHAAAEVTYVSRRPRPRAARDLADAIDLAVDELRAACPDIERPNILLLEAPLRRDLVIPGAGVILISDRFRQVFAPAREYHLGPVIEAVYVHLLNDRLERPDAPGFRWDVEAAAWRQAKTYWEVHRERSSTIDTYLRPFGFIPAVDAFRMAPRIPFIGAFFGDVYDSDPLREDILRFNRRSAHGRIMAEKLRDLLGEDALDRVQEGTLRGDGSMQALAEAEAGQSLDPFLAQWTDPYPEVNYTLAGWEQERQPDGTFRSEVTIRRTGAPIEEPVSVELRRWFGPSHRGQWSGEGREGVVVLETPSRTHRVTLDPDRRLKETTRSDNRRPPSVKFLISSFRFHFDANKRDHEARLGGTLILGNDYRHRYRVYAQTRQTGDGVEFRYVRAFGRAFDAISYQRELSVGFIHDYLSTTFADPESGFENDRGRLSAVTASYGVSTTESRRNRLDGMTLRVQGEAGDTWLGGDFRYWKAEMIGEGVIPIQRDRHLLAWRSSIGASDEKNTPTQVLFDAGGYNAIRGINTGLVLGHYRWLATAEYRWIAVREINAHLLTLAWLRSLQTALYVDAGNVSTSTGDLFDSNPAYGVGAGLRLHFDFFGINPTVVRLDVAERIDRDSGEKRPMFYIGVGQSF